MTRIRIGNQTNCHVPALKPFRYAVEQGFDAFEWFSDYGEAGWNEATFSPEQIREIRRCGEEKNIRFSVHAPWCADPTTSSGQKDILQSIALAGRIDAKVVNIHIFPEYEEEMFCQSLQPLLEAAKQTRVLISLENVASCSPEKINAVFACLRKSEDSAAYTGLCLDIGHAHIYAAPDGDFNSYLEKISDAIPIIHMHIHENDGQRDLHLPLFTGSCRIDESPVERLLKNLRRRQFCGSMIMEQWPSPPEQLVKTRQHLLDLLLSLD